MFAEHPIRSLAAALALLLAPVALLSTPSSATETPTPVDESQLLPNELALAGLAAFGPSWVHAGCIQLGSTCFDVFADNNGDYWVCDECYTTTKPNRGKCRRLTYEEIVNSAWCA